MQTMAGEEMFTYAKGIGAPYELVKMTAEAGRLPVVNFAAGGVATPADAALMMQLGVDGVFVGSGIFKSEEPPRTARAIVKAVTYWQDPEELVRIMEDFAGPMPGLEIGEIPEAALLSKRGW